MQMDSLYGCSMQSSMCFAVEGIMTTLFTPPGCDWSSDDSNSVIEDSSPSRRQIRTTSGAEMMMNNNNTASSSSSSALSPRKVCSMWKKKRKAEKKRLMAMRALQEDHEFHSEIKLSALSIQRSFERRVGDESDEEQQRASYEKYGSRAEFIKSHRL